MVQNSILQFGFLGLCNKWLPSTKPHTMFPLTSSPGFTNGMALYHKENVSNIGGGEAKLSLADR